jgi:hypothetical protein
MAIIKKPGYQDPKLKQTQAILDKQPGAQFIAQKLPQSVLDQIAARRAKLGQPALTQPTQPAADTQPAVQPTAVTQPQRYKDSEDLSPQPTQTDFASGLDDRGLRQYNTYKELAKMKFPNANPDLIENIAQMQTQPYLDALKPKTKLSAVEKFELSDMGVSEAELSAYERGEVSFSDIMKAAKEYKEGRKLELEKTEADKIAEAKRLLDIEYAPRYTRAAESADVSRSTIGRTMAASGRGVSSINRQKLQEAENIYQEQLAAIDAQKQSAMMLREAQIKGATTEELDSLNAQYQRSREALANAQAMSDKLQMEALQTAQQTGNTAMLELIEAIAEDQQNKNNVDFSEELTDRINDGFAYDKQGNRLVDSKGNELTVEEQNLNSQLKYRTTQINPMGGYSVIFTDADNNPVFKSYDARGNLSGVGMGTGEQAVQASQESIGEIPKGTVEYVKNVVDTRGWIKGDHPLLKQEDFDIAKEAYPNFSERKKFDYIESYVQAGRQMGIDNVLLDDFDEPTTQPVEEPIQSTEYPETTGQLNYTAEQQRQIAKIQKAEEDAPARARQAKLDFDKTDFGTTVQNTAGIFNAINKLANFDLNTINNFDPANQQQKIYNALQTMAQFELKEMQNLGTPQAAELALLKEEMGQYTAVDQFFVGAAEGKKTALLSAFNLTDGMARKLRELGTPEETYQLSVINNQLAAIPKNSKARADLEATKQYIQDRLAFVDKIEEAALVFYDQYGQLLNNVN